MSSCKKCSRIKHVTSPSKPQSGYSRVESISNDSQPSVTPSGSSDHSIRTMEDALVDLNDSQPSVTPSGSSDHSIRTMEDALVDPNQSPTLDIIRSRDFSDTLVSIADANVVKKLCTQEEAEATDCPDCDNSPAESTCPNPKAGKTCDTEGCELDHCFVDARPVKKMTLLGRVGRFLSKLTGEGVLWLDKDGNVSVKKYLPFKTSHLWHKWYKLNKNSPPIIGNPMNYPYKVITDLDGNPYTIMGLPNEDSIEVWNHETAEYEQRPITDFPMCVSEKLAPAEVNVELLGLTALNPTDASDIRRCVQRLSGEGMFCLTKVPTAPTQTCDCEDCETVVGTSDETSVVSFIPFPETNCDDDSPYVLTYTPGGGCPTWQQISQSEALKGDPGEKGEKGDQGEKGSDGVVTTYDGCCPTDE